MSLQGKRRTVTLQAKCSFGPVENMMTRSMQRVVSDMKSRTVETYFKTQDSHLTVSSNSDTLSLYVQGEIYAKRKIGWIVKRSDAEIRSVRSIAIQWNSEERVFARIE